MDAMGRGQPPATEGAARRQTSTTGSSGTMQIRFSSTALRRCCPTVLPSVQKAADLSWWCPRVPHGARTGGG